MILIDLLLSSTSRWRIFWINLILLEDSFKPIKIDIHKGVIRIVDEEIHYDFQWNNTESVIVDTDTEILSRFKKDLTNLLL